MGDYDLDRLETALGDIEDNLTSDYGFQDYAVDVGKGAFAGATDAVEETIQFGGYVLDKALEGFGLFEGATGIDDRTFNEGYETDRLLFEPPRPKTAAGEIVEDITQFGVGFLGAGKFKLGQNLVSGAAKKVSVKGKKIKDGGKADKVLSAAGNSMASSMIAHNPYEQRLSDIVEEFPSLQNPVTGWLAADGDDTDAERRLKMALEDLALTGAFETAFMAIAKGAKAVRKSKTPEETAKATEETNSEIAKAAEANKKKRQAEKAKDTKARQAAEREAKKIADRAKKGEDTSDMPRPKTVAYMADDIDNGAAKSGSTREDHLVKNFKHEELLAKATAVGAKVSKKDTKRVLSQKILDKTHPNGKKATAEEPVEVAVKDRDSGVQKPNTRKGFNAQQVKALSEGVKSSKDIKEVFDEAKGGVRLFNRTRDGDVPIVDYNDEVTTIIQDTINAFRPTLDKIKGSKDTAQTNKEIAEMLSATTGLKADDWLNSAYAYGKTIEEATVVLGAIDSLLMESGARLHKIFADKRFNTDLNIKQKGLDELTHFNKLLSAVRSVETPIGRGLQQRKNKILDADALASQAAEFGGEKGLQRFRAAVIASGGDLRAVGKQAAQMPTLKRAGSLGGEFFRSMILFNIKTHVTNTLSGFTETVLVPSERYVGSFLDWRKNPFGQEAKAIREDTYYHMVGLFSTFKDSVRMARQSLLLEKNFLDPANTKVDGKDVQNKITSGFLGIRKDSLLGRNVDTIGKISRGSLRALGAEDEFFKQINYRARIFANAMREANTLMNAGKLDKDGMKAYALKKVDEAFDETGKGLDDAGTQYAREVTFTEDLDKGSMALKFQQATQQHPTLQLILPFVRTPTNLIVRGVQRTPLAYALSRRYRDTLQNGTPAERAQMLGRVALGTTLLGGMTALAFEGKITGAGPVDPAQNKLWRAAGNQPYSIRMGDQWYSYNRFDPVMMPVGLMANFFDMTKHVDEPTVLDVVSTAGFAMSQTIQDKAYLQGITNFLDAITVGSEQDMNRAGTWFENTVTSFIPAAPLQVVEGVQRMTNEEGNYPELREAVGLVDKIRRRLPSLNEQLPAKYNWLTGEAIVNPDPFSTGFPVVPANSKVTEVGTELMRLNYPFRGVPRTLEGIKLESEQLAFWSKQMGSTRINGQTMLESISKLMRNRGYDKSDMSIYDGINLTAEIKAITEIMSAYRSKARAELLIQFPKLKTEYTARRANDRAGRKLLETNR